MAALGHPMCALLAGTRDAAALLGLADEIGTLEPGKRADVVACSGDPLADITLPGDPDNITAVVKDGALHKDTTLHQGSAATPTGTTS